jgi:ribosome biogenesis protein NSA1
VFIQRHSNAGIEIKYLIVNPLFKIFDITQNKVVWKAKNLPHDELDMKVPMWDVDCVYLPNKNVIYTGTAYGEIRMYDRKVKPRPVEDHHLFKSKINRLIISHCENYLIMGDTFGHISFLDRRKSNL